MSFWSNSSIMRHNYKELLSQPEEEGITVRSWKWSFFYIITLLPRSSTTVLPPQSRAFSVVGTVCHLYVLPLGRHLPLRQVALELKLDLSSRSQVVSSNSID